MSFLRNRIVGFREFHATLRKRSDIFSRYQIADGSVLLLQANNELVRDDFCAKLRKIKTICAFLPFFITWLERPDYEWSSIYYELCDQFLGNGTEYFLIKNK
jgi:hypothetical protein